MEKIILLIFSNFLLTASSYAQSDLEKTIKAGEVLLGGITIFKTAKAETRDSKMVESICVKNKLLEKITFIITSKDVSNTEIKKELIVQNEGKECLFNLPKGIYAYEVVMPNKDIYKKGEFKLEEEVTITLKKE